MLLLTFIISCAVVSSGRTSADAHLSENIYSSLNIRIDDNLPKSECLSILSALENAMRSSSQTLYDVLNKTYHFGNVNVHLPLHWNEECIPQALPLTHNFSTNAFKAIGELTESISDITITGTHALLGDQIWTKQYGDCGTGGLQIFASYKSLDSDNSGKLLAKEWLKYRYGVFDEIGSTSDPVYTPCYYNADSKHVSGCAQDELDQIDKGVCDIAENAASTEFYNLLLNFVNERKVSKPSLLFLPATNTEHMICNANTHNRYAPTKQNYLCNRQSMWEVIAKHEDFSGASVFNADHSKSQGHWNEAVQPMAPIFHYKKSHKTRYVAIIDMTLDISVRESWSFLRNAFRKWINYDLPQNTEVGIVLANGRGVERTLPLTALDSSGNRDLIASFLPYSPADTRQLTCINCAVANAIKMHHNRIRTHGGAATVILLIAPGMDPETNLTLFEYMLRPDGQHGHMHFVAVNYPGLVANRRPLDLLVDSLHRGRGFSVHEQKLNAEKSDVTTYVQLVNVLMHIASLYFEPNSQSLPLEIHRNIIYDSATNYNNNNNRNNYNYVNGEFYLEKNFGQPAGFYIYTHSAESPLIHAIRLISPSNRIYTTRSDQRMVVKQISIISPLNETGRWQYEIQRYPGNPQPHIVQVMATPQPHPPIEQMPQKEKSLGPIADFKTTQTTVRSPLLPYIKIKAWIEQRTKDRDSHGSHSNKLTIVVLYCEVMYGSYYPVRNANATAKIRHYDRYMSPINEYDILLRDTGNGDSDIQLGDGIYSRNMEIHKEGIYVFDFYVKGIPHYTYTMKSSVFQYDAVLPNVLATYGSAGTEFGKVVRLEFEEIMRKGGNSDHNSTYLQMTGGFERYGPQLTLHIDANALSDPNYKSIKLGRVLNLRCNYYKLNYEFIECSWPKPDFGCCTRADNDDTPKSSQTVYQLKYGWSLFDLITNFDDAPLLFNGTQYHTLLLNNSNNCMARAPSEEHCDIVNYRHDISQSPQIHGKYVNIALRSISSDGTRSPISNVAQLYIPEQPVQNAENESRVESKFYYPSETEPTVATTTNEPYNDDVGSDTWNSSIARTKAASHVDLLMWILPFSLIFLLLCSTVCIFCYVTRCRPNPDKQNCEDTQDTPLQIEATTSEQLHNITAVVIEPQHKEHHMYANNFTHPDQSIGIPVVDETERNCMCGKNTDTDQCVYHQSRLATTPHVYTIETQSHGVDRYDNAMNYSQYHTQYQPQPFDCYQKFHQISNVEIPQTNVRYADNNYRVDDGVAPVIPPLPLLISNHSSPLISENNDYCINTLHHSYAHNIPHQHDGVFEQGFQAHRDNKCRNVTVV